MIRRPSSAAKRINSAVRTTSPMAALIPFATSLARMVPIFSLSRSKMSAVLCKYAARSTGAKSRHAGRAARAAFIASSTSA